MLIVSLPSIVTNNVFRTDPTTVDLNAPTDLVGNFDDVSATITSCVQAGYDAALSRVSAIIADGGYDQELSMQALVNYGLQSSDYDICYTLAAYSASLEQRGTSKADLEAKLLAVADQMFPVTYTTATATVTSTVTTEAGTQVVEFQVTYAICTIHPFDQSVILTAFNLDTNAIYNQFQITTGEAILNMSNALKMTMYGSLENGMVPPITDAELNAYLASLTCSETRKELMRVALSLVGRVPYFWGGKSPPGWNEAWNTPRLVTSAGSSSTGTLRPKQHWASRSMKAAVPSGITATSSRKQSCCPATSASWPYPAQYRSIMCYSTPARMPAAMRCGHTAPAAMAALR